MQCRFYSLLLNSHSSFDAVLILLTTMAVVIRCGV